MSSKPNIIFILADDLGYGDVSIHHGPHVHTPNIDRIAQEGMRFTRFYANSCVCSPSRAALLTGRYPDMVGVPGVIRQTVEDNWGYFDPAAITLPDMMRRAGYHTMHVGKWHLGLEDENHPCERGFDEYHGFIDDMMDDYWTHRRFGKNGMRHNRREIDPEGHATDLFTEWAVEYIENREEVDEPFFLYLAYNAPHTPIQPKDEWVEAIRVREPEISEQRLQYVALVEHMDDGIGQVLDALEQAGLSEDTIVMFSSDNGGWIPAGACNDPLRGSKCDMYEGGIRVPFCVRWPGKIAPDSTSDEIAMLMDVFPTLCEVAGADVSHEIEGRTILPLLTGDSVDFGDRYYYWVRRDGWHGSLFKNDRYVRPILGHDYHAVRHGDIKLLQNSPFAPLELFDLSADERETTDLMPEQRPEAVDLARYLQGQIRRAGGIRWQKPSPDSSKH